MYSLASSGDLLTQGDILAACPINEWDLSDDISNRSWSISQAYHRVLVLTQACDLMNSKAQRVQIAVVHDVEKMVELGVLSRATIRDHVRLHRVFGMYFLPQWEGHLPESIVDLRDLHTVPLRMLQELADKVDRVRVMTPYREHLAQHFAVTYSRIALPEPYQTK